MEEGDLNIPGLLVERHSGVLRLTIDRPEKRNALTDDIVSGLIDELVAAVGGVARRLDDAQRSRYHATATVAANHLVALLAHVESLAVSAGLTLEDFLPLARRALEDVATYGPHEALTGPASRGDMVTIDAHLQAIPESERATYVALANAAFELAELRRTEMLT